MDSLPLTTRENPYFLINISNWLEFSHPVAGKSNLEHISYSCNEKTLSYWLLLLLLLLLSRFSHVWLCATPWTTAYQAPPCIGFSRQEYWSGLPFPSPILLTAAAAAKSLQLCPTLCESIDSSLPGSPVPGILQARTLEWVAVSFSNARKWKVKSESEVAQSCPTLSDPMDFGPPGSSVHGIFQARVLE